MGGGISKPAGNPLGNSHGNHALLHQQLVQHALLRREDLQDMSRRGASKYNAMTEVHMGAYEALREIQRDDERNREYEERNKMTREDKNRPTGRGRGRGRRD